MGKTLGEVELLTKDYAAAHDKLTDKVRELEDEINAVKKKHMRFIKQFAETAIERKSKLSNALEESKDLFVKPKSIVLHGFKIGLQKTKGKIEFPNIPSTINLIKKYFPLKKDVFIKTEEKIVFDALKTLSVDEIKKIGANVIGSVEEVLIKPTGSDIEKVVTALLKEEPKDDTELAKSA